MSNPTTHLQISAGGVAFRCREGRIEVILILTHTDDRWQLPKGIVESGESTEAAAVREVREETGIVTDSLDLLDKIEYWFFGDLAGKRIRFHKFVYFYLLRYRSGESSAHDQEVLEARWFDLEEALTRLAFPNERKIVRLAQERLETVAQ